MSKLDLCMGQLKESQQGIKGRMEFVVDKLRAYDKRLDEEETARAKRLRQT
jgi:hypothetical protein